MTRLIRYFSVLLMSVSLTLMAGFVAADGYYSGKTVKLIVGYSPGGGYDTYARLLAPHIAAQLGAKVIVENQPGAGGIVALNKFADAKPDGLSILLLNGTSAALAQMLGHKAAKFDLNKVNWLGRIVAEPRILSWGGKVSFKSVQEAKSAIPLFHWGAGGNMEDLSVTAAIASEILNLNSKIVLGYKGSKKVALAAMQQEVQAAVFTAGTTRKYGSKGNITPFMVMGPVRSELLPDIPTVHEIMSVSEEHQALLDFFNQVNRLGRAFIGSPGVPEARIKALSDAVDAVLTDGAVIAMAKKQKRLISYMPAAEVSGLLSAAYAATDKIGDAKLKHILLEKYY